ncbi:CFEM domain-containing protein [Colletotrichum chrysophilum]|uniref:CFEM domain-containing protein n=1 Tax=Colletotrichum chrysophilum TaxID=1836956 RepID=A0AAD9A2I0_9PEZI|nr:CFEM domain-containing protein [Colletotrichum chrysophilum]
MAIAGVARLAVASPFTDALAAAPACAVTCTITALPQSPCTIENTTCLCTNPIFNGLVGECVQKGCTIKEALTVQNLTWSACGFPSTDKRHTARYAIGCLIILPVIFMAIRLASWAFSLTPWGAEDTTVSLALILFIPFPTLVLIIDLALIKASILYLYLRVFHVSSIRAILWGTQVFNLLLCTLFVLVSIFQCQPIQHYWNGWDGEHAGKCLSLQDIVLTHVAINVGLDVWMLILPLTQIYKLKMPLRRKISVMTMFSIGIFLTIVSIIRIKSLLDFAKTPNITGEYSFSEAVLHWDNNLGSPKLSYLGV